MDKNKLKVLREIDYVIPKQCQLCEHGTFPSAGSPFGTCNIQTYEHLKHTGEPRQLSIYVGGSCSKWVPDEDAIFDGLGDWAEFVDRREFTRPNRGKLVSKKVRY